MQPRRRAARGEGNSHAPFLTGAVALAALLSASAVQAQAPCDRRDSVLRLLAQRYKEAPVAVGVTTEGSLVEVLSNANGGTWTIIVTSPQGLSCLILSGDGWRPVLRRNPEPQA